MDSPQNDQSPVDADSDANDDPDTDPDRAPTRDRESIEDIAREYAPANQTWPTLPGGFSEDGWEFRTVHHRTCPGRTEETELCPTTGEQLPVTEPHICLTARRDPYPNTHSQSAEYKQFIFETPEQLRAWFESDQE